MFKEPSGSKFTGWVWLMKYITCSVYQLGLSSAVRDRKQRKTKEDGRQIVQDLFNRLWTSGSWTPSTQLYYHPQNVASSFWTKVAAWAPAITATLQSTEKKERWKGHTCVPIMILLQSCKPHFCWYVAIPHRRGWKTQFYSWKSGAQLNIGSPITNEEIRNKYWETTSTVWNI